MKATLVACLVALPLGVLPAQAPSAQTPSPGSAEFKYERGRIVLRNGLATLDVPAGFRYLDPEQTEVLLTKDWGNPSGDGTLGMLFPSDVDPMADEGWGVVITYEEDGFVKDDDAAGLDYGKILKQMQDATADDNKARKKNGYESIALAGWAEPPHYDAASHKLYWAQDLKFGGNEHHTLNYHIRVLGRRGVLVMNAVAGLDQLPRVKAGMNQVITFVNFNEGHQYADFDPSSDKVAAYGIGALIAGTVAAKAGLFKVLLAALIAAKKLLIVAAVAVAGFVRRLFKGKASQQAAA